MVPPIMVIAILLFLSESLLFAGLQVANYTHAGSKRFQRAKPTGEQPRVPKPVAGIKREVMPVKATTREIMGYDADVRPSYNPFYQANALPGQVPGIPTILKTFLGAYYQDTGQYGPSADGSVGSTQFIVGSKGRIRSFNKFTGQIDGVLNIAHDRFFSSISNGGFTADPNILFDQLSNRWFLFCDGNTNFLLAMSDGDPITPSTVWSFITVDTVTDPHFQAKQPFFDYSTLAADANAVLCAGDVYDLTLTDYFSSAVYAITKASLLSGGPIVIYSFRNLVDQANFFGPASIQGAQNFDPVQPLSYFIGINANDFINGVGTKFIINKVTYTSTSASLSAPLVLTLHPFANAIPSPVLGTPTFHLVNDITTLRPSVAHIRYGMLWTSFDLGVNNTGASGPSVMLTRNGSRFLGITIPGLTIATQGTLFAATPTNDYNQRHFLTSSVMTNSLNQVLIGATTCGRNERLNASVTQIVNGVAQTPVLYTTSVTNYLAQEDWEFTPYARWGDHTRLSPNPGDSTIWAFQQWCSDTNTWGLQAAQVQLN